MGSFNWKQEQISDIILSNSGEEYISAIEDVSVSCGCITVEYLKRTDSTRSEIKSENKV